MGSLIKRKTREKICRVIISSLTELGEATSKGIMFYARNNKLVSTNLYFGTNRLGHFLAIMERQGIVKKRRGRVKAYSGLITTNLWSLK